MNLSAIISSARERRASDVHLEAGLPVAMRVSSNLQVAGEPLPLETVTSVARQVVGEDGWSDFLQRGSADLSRTIEGVRCRINVMQTARGPGLAIRLLSSFTATIEKLNLHPDLKKLIANPHGLILVSGPTGSGKSSTLAALIQEINVTEALHIITLEHPIEYQFRPVKSFIRQREIGRDSPSFDQGLLDAMREDPDVLMVGEMRDPETMRLTLNASETGHLVFGTIHSSSAVEALQRLVLAFPSEIQNSISAQLADCLCAVVCQRLRYESRLGIRLPECEILMPNHAIKNFIRRGEFFKIASVLETGADHGMWTFARYRAWMESRKEWHMPNREHADLPSDESLASRPGQPIKHAPAHVSLPRVEKKPEPTLVKPAPAAGARIEIEPDESEFGKILKRP
jgi:twitching motility protein PilT